MNIYKCIYLYIITEEVKQPPKPTEKTTKTKTTKSYTPCPLSSFSDPFYGAIIFFLLLLFLVSSMFLLLWPKSAITYGKTRRNKKQQFYTPCPLSASQTLSMGRFFWFLEVLVLLQSNSVSCSSFCVFCFCDAWEKFAP